MYRIGQTKSVYVYDLYIEGSIDIWRMSKNTYKYQLQKKFKEKPYGTISKLITNEDTRELYNMLVSNSKITDEKRKKIQAKEDEILKLHVQKFANNYENMLNSYDICDEKDGDDDGFLFDFESDSDDDFHVKDEIEQAVDSDVEDDIFYQIITKKRKNIQFRNESESNKKPKQIECVDLTIEDDDIELDQETLNIINCIYNIK